MALIAGRIVVRVCPGTAAKGARAIPIGLEVE